MSALNNVVQLKPNRVTDKPVKLTNANITKLLPRLKRYDVKDTTVTGLRVRVNISGSKIYVAVGRVRGTTKTRTLTIGNSEQVSLDEARKGAIKFLANCQLGKDTNEEKRIRSAKSIPLRELLDEYLTTRKLKASTVKDYHYDLNRYCSKFMNKQVSTITQDQVCNWYKALSHIPASADKCFRFLKGLMEYAVAIKAIEENPCHAVTNRRLRYKQQVRVTRVSAPDMTKFINSLIQLKRDGVTSSLHTDLSLMLIICGTRLTETITIKNEFIDWDDMVIKLPDTKTGRMHIIPLHPLLLSIIKSRQESNKANPRLANNPYLFATTHSKTGHVGTCIDTLKKITEHAKIPSITPHDCRRTFSTMADECGLTETDVKAALNHSVKDTLGRHYLQSKSIENKRRNLFNISEWLESRILTPMDIDDGQGEQLWHTRRAIRVYLYDENLELDFYAVTDNLSIAEQVANMQ